MKTFSFIVLIFIGIMFLLATTGTAQMHGSQDGKMPMTDQMMHDHMTSMAKLMSEMAEAMQQGQMTPAQQAQCGAFMQRMSGLMRDLAADPQQGRAERGRSELQELEKEWNYFKDQNRSLYGH